MRILYGVNGEGMGHATRSEVVIADLLSRHDVRVVASGAAFRYLGERLPRVDEVLGPTFALGEGEIRRWATVRQNVHNVRRELPGTVRRWISSIDDWKPEVVITDFEPLAGVYARLTRSPLLAVDNIHMLDRCLHDEEIIGAEREDYRLARAVAHNMVPRAAHYLVTTFFEARIGFDGTTLIPPILRPEIAEATGGRGEHLLVYSSGDPRLLEALRSSGLPCRVYGMRGGDAGGGIADGALEFKAPSKEGFVEDLRTARCVVTGGGFSLLSEAVYLRKPVLSVPLRGQFEQLMNARYLQRNRYGLAASVVTEEVMTEFISRLDEFEEALDGYEQDGNAVALRTIEERATEAASTPPRELRKARRTTRMVAR